MKSKIDKKAAADNRNAYQILEEFARERRQEYSRAHQGVAILGREDVDTASFMHRNPNDRIAFAVESGLFPRE